MTVEDRIEGRRIGIIGMGRSGLAAAMLASNYGAEPFVSDAGKAKSLTNQINQLRQYAIPFETGCHTERLLKSDFIIVSPGVQPQIDILKQAVARGIPIFSEIEFASWVCRGKIVAVTGSNGKTTTTTLIGEMFSAAGYDTFVCGNIGLPFTQVADKIGRDAIAVVEVSTFQLERIADFKPHVALILNLSPDHLDRHGSFEEYKKLKYRITENQTVDDFLILNNDDRNIIADNVTSAAAKLYFTTQNLSTAPLGACVREGVLYAVRGEQSEKVIDIGDIRIPGPHNLQNVAAAVAATIPFEIEATILGQVLTKFPGVEHRCEEVDRVAGINFVNDSKATNVDSVCCALRSIDTPIYLIAGGRDKGGSYAPVVEHGKGRIKGIVLIGEAREKMFEALGKTFPTVFADSIEEAVQKCFQLARPGETILLSPGCASFDMFENYEHRGRAFKAAISELKTGKRSNETVSD